MSQLNQLTCSSCNTQSLKLSTEQINARLREVDNWQLTGTKELYTIEKTFSFENFNQALRFTTKLGELAESENHHPAILTEWGKVKVLWWTHIISGLHLNDFIMAAKTDQLFENLKKQV